MDIWATHLPALVACVMATKGPVLEVGCGWYSTPVLHELCKGRNLVTVESNREWLDRISPGYGSKEHSFIYSPDYSKALIGLSSDHWGVVFVDNDPEGRRVWDAERFAHSADYVLIHDYDSSIIKYGADQLKSLFPFHFVHSRFPHHTLVLGQKEIPEIP